MIKWMENKHKGRNASNHDFQVMISIIKNGTSKEGAEKRAVAVRFYHSKEKEITNTGRLQIGIDEETERIYFASASGTKGYKLSGSKKNVRVVQFMPDDLSKWESYVGGYVLQQDLECKLFYVDISERKQV